MRRKILDVARHRNGCSGNPFYVVRFREGRDVMLGVVFDEQGNVAVFNEKLLGEGVIAWGENSWRGDDYEDFLREAAGKYDQKVAAATTGEEIAKVQRGGKTIWKE